MTERDRDVDVVVIGMGPGGEYAAGTLAEAGLVVAGWRTGSSAANARTLAVSRPR